MDDVLKVLVPRSGRHVEVCSGRCRKCFIWTIRGSMWRFAPDDIVMFFSYLDDAGWHVEVRSGRFRTGVIWTMRVSMWSVAQGDFVKVFPGRSGVACGGLLKTICKRLYLDDVGWHVKVCSGRLRKGFIWTIRDGMWSFAQADS